MRGRKSARAEALNAPVVEGDAVRGSMNTDRTETLDPADCKWPGGEGREPLVVHTKLGSKLTPCWQKIIGRHPMARALRIAGLAIFTAVAFAWAIHREPAKPIPVPLPVAKDEANLEPRTVRVNRTDRKVPGHQQGLIQTLMIVFPVVADPVGAGLGHSLYGRARIGSFLKRRIAACCAGEKSTAAANHAACCAGEKSTAAANHLLDQSANLRGSCLRSDQTSRRKGGSCSRLTDVKVQACW
jgi:hypothetical protein